MSLGHGLSLVAGLSQGTGLQWQAAIGTAGLIVGPFISAPVITINNPGNESPSVRVTLGATVVAGDVLDLEYQTDSDFDNPSTLLHTLSAGDISTGYYDFSVGSLSDGTWYFQARAERGANVSPWSATVSDDITGGGMTGQPIGMLLALTYA